MALIICAQHVSCKTMMYVITLSLKDGGITIHGIGWQYKAGIPAPCLQPYPAFQNALVNMILVYLSKSTVQSTKGLISDPGSTFGKYALQNHRHHRILSTICNTTIDLYTGERLCLYPILNKHRTRPMKALPARWLVIL